MIIELPILPSTKAAKRFRMAFFHFSNNNLSIRRDCALAVGGYDPDMRTSEDVEICFRVALSDRWVACREPGVVVRHKARGTVSGMVKQLWGWGINLGKAYRKTGRRGIYLYWVSRTDNSIARDLEIERFPFLVTAFFTWFHVAHLVVLGATVLALTGAWQVALAVLATSFALLLHAMWTVTGRGLGPWGTFKLGCVAYLANVTFMSAAIFGSLRAGIVYVPAAMFPPAASSERIYHEEELGVQVQERTSQLRDPQVAHPE